MGGALGLSRTEDECGDQKTLIRRSSPCRIHSDQRPASSSVLCLAANMRLGLTDSDTVAWLRTSLIVLSSLKLLLSSQPEAYLERSLPKPDSPASHFAGDSRAAKARNRSHEVRGENRASEIKRGAPLEPPPRLPRGECDKSRGVERRGSKSAQTFLPPKMRSKYEYLRILTQHPF